MSRFDSFGVVPTDRQLRGNYISILLATARPRCYSIIKPGKLVSATILMARFGFPSSRVASQQLVPYAKDTLAALGTQRKMFEITSEASMRTTESYGILRGAMPSYRNPAKMVTAAGVSTSCRYRSAAFAAM